MSKTPRRQAARAYESGPTNQRRRPRRTRTEMARIEQAMLDTLRADNPATCRGLFYRLVSAGVVEKSEAAYKGLVVRLATRLRLEGRLPFRWIADNTRWQYGGTAYQDVDDWFSASLRAYRLDIWANQPEYVEVWLEKDALTGVLLKVTDPLHVPLMVCRGYPSLTYLANAGANIRNIDRPTHLYYLGDRDPSGVDIPRVVEKRLREFAPEVDITFTRLAVTEEQIEELNLPTRPTKRTDSRSRNFKGESVEVDAIPAATLRAMVKARVERHLDPSLVEAMKAEEEAGRETLREFQARLRGADE